MKYHQTKTAYIAKYIAYRWILACLTFGYLAVVDYLQYKRKTLTVNDKSLELQYGVFSKNSRELFYKNIQGVNVNQSVLGRMFNYGDLVINTANQNESVVFNNIEHPQVLRQAIQTKI